MAVALDLDFTNLAFRADPYPFFQRVRAADPVHWNPPGVWLITRYADAMAILRDPNIGHSTGRSQEYTDYLLQQGKLSPLELLLSQWMLSKNPPDHTRLRRLVSYAFTPGVVEGLRPQIQTMVDGLLDQAQRKGSFDLIADVAYPLPVMVIAALLGVPPEDRERFKSWVRDTLGVVDLVVTPEAAQRGNIAIQKLLDYFRDLIGQRRASPQDDLLSSLIAAHEEGQRLTEPELLANCILLLIAGHETTMNLLGNGMLALLSNPDQYAKLQETPSLISSTVEELLRYDSPVQFFGRAVFGDMTIGGKTLRKGQGLFSLPGAINRDPDQFSDPERLDIARQDNHHLAFGYGIHFCLGAPLARLEGQIAIGEIARRFPNLKLQQPPERQETLVIRGLKSLLVAG